MALQLRIEEIVYYVLYTELVFWWTLPRRKQVSKYMTISKVNGNLTNHLPEVD